MDLHRLGASDCLRLVASSLDGLPSGEPERRRAGHGWNEVPERRARPVALMLVRQFTHLFAVILWIGAALSFGAAWVDRGGGMSTLGTAIVAVIAVNGIFSFVQEYRADRAVAALRNMLPLRVRAVRAGAVVQIHARELVPGDVVLLEAGDQVPADCRVLSALSVRVNTSTLTGESVPEWRDERPSAGADPLRCTNALLAGTFLVSGRARAVVLQTGRGTQLARMAVASQAGDEALSPLQKEIDRLARLIAAVAGAIGIFFLLVGHLAGVPMHDDLLFAVGIIVANVPEGLLPCITLSLAMASQRMARRNALVRRLPAVEALGCATVICTDKTGTLTQNRMEVKSVFAAGRRFGKSPSQLRDAARSAPALFEGAALCHDLVYSPAGGRSGDPMEVALSRMGEAALGAVPEATRLLEAPFDPDRRRLATLHRTSAGAVLHVKGALETVLPLCAFADAGNGAEPLAAQLRSALLREESAMAAEGLRVLAFAHSRPRLDGEPRIVEEGLTFSGLVGLEDPPRPEVAHALEVCRSAGIRVVMVTGDHPGTALAVARQVGLVRGTGRLLTGAGLRAMDDRTLCEALRAQEIVVARADPVDKRRVVAALQSDGEVVAVTGDGANDAPALRAADIGVAMGLSGTDLAREAADLVLLDDNFATIVSAIEEGRAVYANARKFLAYILTSNVPELVPYLAFVLLRVPLALTILQILAVDLGTDMLPALALGAEPPAPDVMKQPPRRHGQRLADAGLLLRAYGFLGVLEAAAAMSVFFLVLYQGGWTWGRPLDAVDPLYLRATTACLTAIVVVQVANVLVCRTETAPAWSRGLLRNRLLIAGIAAELVLIVLIDHTTTGNAVFGTAPLPLSTWVAMVPFALVHFAIEEARKAFVRQARAVTASAPQPG